MEIVRREPSDPAAAAECEGLLAAHGLPLDGLPGLWRLWVALDGGGDPLGCAGLERHGAEGCEAYLLRSVAVRETDRGRGTGAALVTAALAEVPPGRPVGLLTETAAEWFERFGFRRVAREGLPPVLSGSVELTSACPASAQALLLERRSPKRPQ